MKRLLKIGLTTAILLGIFLSINPILVAISPFFILPSRDTTKIAPSTKIPRTLPFIVRNQVQIPKPIPSVNLLGKTQKTLPVITLGKSNTLSLREPITGKSAARLQRKLIKMSLDLPKTTPIYLVINSPGGSLSAGNLLIDTVAALPQEVRTISIFSASMAYHLVQAFGTRYILPSGTLMSHRARITHIGGEFPGELDNRLNWIRKALILADTRASVRLKMVLKDYQEMIRDEYWVEGSDAVTERSADFVALLKCSSEMIGIEELKLNTLFGPLMLHFSKCPLITYPLEVDPNRLIFRTVSDRKKFNKFLQSFLFSKEDFVKTYMVTGTYRNFILP